MKVQHIILQSVYSLIYWCLASNGDQKSHTTRDFNNRLSYFYWTDYTGRCEALYM